MIKKVVLPAKVGIQHPKWFYKSMEHLHQGNDLHFQKSGEAKFTPAGEGLFELLRSEAKVLQRTLSGDIPTSRVLPFYSKTFCMDWFEGSLKPLFLEHFLSLNEKILTEDEGFDLRLLYSEITQNARDHSGSERFLVILGPGEIGVYDLGVSIPAKLEQKYDFKDDLDSIEGALKKGITTRRTRPGGLGLYYTLSQIRERSGTLFIASRYGQVRRYLRDKKVFRKKIQPPMRGTLIHCSFENEKKKKGTK